MKIKKRSWNAWVKHCLKVYPQEACGLIKSGEIVIVDNVSKDPENTFAISPKVIKEHKPSGMIHSHPYDVKVALKTRVDRRMPSKADMQARENFGMSKGFGIVAVDGLNVSDPLWLNDTPDLLERSFIHGHTDCYSIIRQWFKQEKDIDLPYAPREWEWWFDPDASSMYLDNFEKAGFEQIDERDADVGDVVLFQIQSDVVNHAGVIVESNQILHHLYGQLSCIEPHNQYMDRQVMVVRYVGVQDE